MPLLHSLRPDHLPLAVVLHAGAGESYRDNPEETAAIRRFLEALIRKADNALQVGVPAIEVVTDITAALEDAPYFNAGRGAALNILGKHELEAAVVDGSTGEYRAVLGTKHTKNPVRLAKVLLHYPDVAILAGRACDKLAAKHGLDTVSNRHFTLPAKYQYWSINKAKHREQNLEQHGTVGAVALDRYGNLAAANSTGGTMFKRVGRIGDTAINGAGIFADQSVAVACSGSGEAILKTLVAKSTADHAHRGMPLDEAARSALLASASQSILSSCGIIVVDCHGAISVQSNARTFAIASASTTSPMIADIIRSSLTHLKQLIFFEDESVSIGFAKYPTMAGQTILEIKNAKTLQTLKRQEFERVWQIARLCAMKLKSLWNVPVCSALAAGRAIHFFPHDCVTAAEDNGSVVADTELWQSLQDKSNMLKGATVKTYIQLELHARDSSDCKTSVQVAQTTDRHSRFPRPEVFHNKYPGYMSLEPGLRARNLHELPRMALAMAQSFADEISTT